MQELETRLFKKIKEENIGGDETEVGARIDEV